MTTSFLSKKILAEEVKQAEELDKLYKQMRKNSEANKLAESSIDSVLERQYKPLISVISKQAEAISEQVSNKTRDSLAIEGPKSEVSNGDAERTYDILSRAMMTRDRNKDNVVFEDGIFKLNGNPIVIEGAYVRINNDAYEMTPGLAYLMTRSKATQGDSVDKYDAYVYAMMLSKAGVDISGNNGKLRLLEKYGIVFKDGKWFRVSLPTEDEPGEAYLVPIGSTYRPKPPTTPKPAYQRKVKASGNGMLPSNPLSLYKMLDLRLAAYKAGNKGLRNEIIAISDELLRQGIIKKGDYKKITMVVLN